MSQPKGSSRPTSPHLQIYKWNVSSFTSIMHRLTGIALYFSLLAISWYIVYYAYQIDSSTADAVDMETCNCWLREILTDLFTIASVVIIFALYYHFLNGIRHLFWDIGKGFEKNTAKRNGLIVIIFSFVLTVVTLGSALYLKLF